MRFLFLCHSLDVGGLETYMLRFARWLSEKHPDQSLSVICKSGQFGSYQQDFRALGAALHAMPMGYWNPAPYVRLCRFLAANRFDAVCDFGGDFGALPMIAAYAAQGSKRMVFYRSARNAYTPTWSRRCYQSVLNRLVRVFSTDILSNSQEAFDYYFPDLCVASDPRFKVIRNGIPAAGQLACRDKEELRHQLDIAEGQKVVLHVGSGRWEKNHACILQIARQAQERGEDVCFCLVGPGVEAAMGAMAQQLALKNLRFLGERRDVDSLLQIAHVFLFPSLSEGQPNALLEAMTRGVPFIASDIAPICEALAPDWGSRWLFAPDRPDQGYALLQQHLSHNYRDDTDFRALVAWCHSVYDEDRCFRDFHHRLSSPEERPIARGVGIL